MVRMSRKVLFTFLVLLMFGVSWYISSKTVYADAAGVPDQITEHFGVFDEEGILEDAGQKASLEEELAKIYEKYKVNAYIIITTKIGMSDDYEGYLTMVSTLRQLDENWKVVKSYSMEHRTFFISGDFKILGYGGDGDPEVYTIDEFNDWFGDENRQKSGLDVQITIKDGLVCEVAICS